MFVPLQRLILRSRHGRTRADELVELHRRLRAEQRVRPGRAERAAAATVRALKIRVSAELARVTSCASCASGKPAPRGVFAGGDCCTGVTAELFSDDELAAIVHAEARVQLRAPTTEHAGCAFRGEAGCSLSPGDRPERCVTYTCGTLRRELHAGGELSRIDALLAELHAAMQRYSELRRSRLDDDLIGSVA